MMDTSKKYIEMCTKAKEIQQTWECDDSDFMAARPRSGVFHLDEEDKEWIIWTVCDYYSAACYYQREKKEDHPQAHESYFDEYSDVFRQFDGGYEWGNELIAKRKDCIWLPRQDQLQEMITNKGYFGFSLIELFYHFANEWHRKKGGLNSMEQLWLAFVMKEKYNKTWNDKDWVK